MKTNSIAGGTNSINKKGAERKILMDFMFVEYFYKDSTKSVAPDLDRCATTPTDGRIITEDCSSALRTNKLLKSLEGHPFPNEAL